MVICIHIAMFRREEKCYRTKNEYTTRLLRNLCKLSNTVNLAMLNLAIENEEKQLQHN